MKSIRLRDDFYWTGIIDDQLRVFDIIMYTEFGTSYNSYVMKAGDKTVLFETAKAKFFDDYLEKLQEVTDVHKIDYLVVSHTEPDHAGSVERLLDYSPQMKIIATGCAIGFLKEIVNRDFVGIPARVYVCAKPALAGHHVYIYRGGADPGDLRFLRLALLSAGGGFFGDQK